MESNAPAIASLVDENIAENDTIRRTGKEEFTNGNRDTEEGKNVTKNGTAAAASEEAQQKNRGDVKDKENNSKSPLPKLRLLGADSAKVATAMQRASLSLVALEIALVLVQPQVPNSDRAELFVVVLRAEVRP